MRINDGKGVIDIPDDPQLRANQVSPHMKNTATHRNRVDKLDCFIIQHKDSIIGSVTNKNPMHSGNMNHIHRLCIGQRDGIDDLVGEGADDRQRTLVTVCHDNLAATQGVAARSHRIEQQKKKKNDIFSH